MKEPTPRISTNTLPRRFFVPPIVRWKNISDNAKKTEIVLDNAKKVDIGGYVGEAMEAIERQNPSLKGVLPKVYARQNLDRASLGGLIDLSGTMKVLSLTTLTKTLNPILSWPTRPSMIQTGRGHFLRMTLAGNSVYLQQVTPTMPGYNTSFTTSPQQK